MCSPGMTTSRGSFFGFLGSKFRCCRQPLNIDEDFAVFDLDGVRLQLLIGMVVGRAGLWIPSPAVPGADDPTVFDHALPERAALMEAHVIHGADLSPDVGNADHFPVAGEVARFVDRGKMGLGNDFDEGHSSFSRSSSFAAEILRFAQDDRGGHLGCSVCAIITWRLKFSTMFGSRRTSVGFLARVMVSILSCSLSSA